MKYRIEISEESLRIIGLAVEEYMRIRMGQFETLSEDLVYEGKDRGKLYEDQYKFACTMSAAGASRKCSIWATRWHFRRSATGSGSTIRGERALTSSTPSSISSVLMRQRAKKRHPAPHIAPTGLFRWAESRTRKSRRWKNELPVL